MGKETWGNNPVSAVVRVAIPVLAGTISLFLIAVLPGAGVAQGTFGDTNVRLYTLSGNVSLQGHGYTTNRSVNRREPLGALTTANLSYSVLGFRSGLSFRYSTDDSRLRQSMNEIGFSGSWRWISVAAGDVSPNHSRFGMSGTRIRGGEIRLSPGLLRFEAGVGQANRAVDFETGTGLRQPSFERWIYATKIGYGSTSGSYFNLSGLYGRDIAGSIRFPDDPDLMPPGIPVPSPAENLSLTPDFQVSLFNRAFRLGAETTFSAFSRDTRSPALDASDSGAPGWIIDLFRPRVSTRVSFAGQAHTELNIDPFQLRVGYERIQPGFESIGQRQMRDDQQLWTFQPRLYLFGNRFSIDSSVRIGRDNLLGNRLFTQKRQDISLNTRTQITGSFSLGAGFSLFDNRTEATSDSPDVPELSQRQLSRMFQLQPVLMLFSGNISHSIAMAGVYQQLDARLPSNYQERNSGSSTITSMLTYTLGLPSGLSLNSSLNGLWGEAAGSDFTAYGITLGSGFSFFDRSLTLNLSGGYSQNSFTRPTMEGPGITTTSRQVNGNIMASYRITTTNSLRLNLRSMSNFADTGGPPAFSEFDVRLQYQHNF
ncbi:MAG: hypothetical protein EA364_06875 [Balneolaceae bacterium]|nr:MAG: hypothetical protein EA364_06875 [Balneolaceae bacterium]